MRRVLIFLMVVLAVFGFSKYTFYLVSHGGPADPFWAVVMKGLKDAGENME